MPNIDEFEPSGKSKLKSHVKEAWLKELRGSKRQVQNNLRARREDGRTGYCCLGILCGLGDKAKSKWKMRNVFTGVYEYDGERTFPPKNVLRRSGLNETDAGILGDMNDSGIGFKRIANWIEKHL